MTSAEANDNGVERRLSDSHSHQINVLKTLSGSSLIRRSEAAIIAVRGAVAEPPRHFDINEIAEMSGLKDEKEVQRYLFILEGQKLVAPFPEGDFTSKTWHITKNGVKALKTIQTSTIQ